MCKTAAALLDINEAVARRSGSAEETPQRVTQQINKTWNQSLIIEVTHLNNLRADLNCKLWGF